MSSLDSALIRRSTSLGVPYWDLSECRDLAAGFSSRFRPEHSLGPEVGPVSSGELYRHLANAGACAAARTMGLDAHFFLGQRARLSVVRAAEGAASITDDIETMARVLSFEKSRAVTWSSAKCPGWLATFYCEHQVLGRGTFLRLFKPGPSAAAWEEDGSPYRCPVDTQLEEPDGLSVIARAIARPGRFAGHFDDYPSWPASIYAEIVAQTLGHLVSRLHGASSKIEIARLDCRAHRLLPETEPVEVHVFLEDDSMTSLYRSFKSEVRWKDGMAADFTGSLLIHPGHTSEG